MIIKMECDNHCDLYTIFFIVSFFGGGGEVMSPCILLLHVFSVIALDICVHASRA